MKSYRKMSGATRSVALAIQIRHFQIEVHRRRRRLADDVSEASNVITHVARTRPPVLILAGGQDSCGIGPSISMGGLVVEDADET